MEYRDFYSELLTESMIATVSGRDYSSEKRQTILGLSFLLTRSVIDPVLDGLSVQDKEYFDDHRVMDILTSDGNDSFKPVGILNFYTAGLKADAIEKVLKGIKYFAKEYDIELGTFRGPEQSRAWGGHGGVSSKSSQVIRIPVIKNFNDSKYVPEVQLANHNARMVFGRLLQLPDFEEGYRISAIDLSNAIKRVEDKIKQDDEFLYRFSNPFTVDKSGGATMISGGTDPDYFIGVLARIKELVDYAIDHGNLDIVIN